MRLLKQMKNKEELKEQPSIVMIDIQSKKEDIEQVLSFG